MRKRILVFLVLALILAGTSVTFAQKESANVGKERGISPLFTYITEHYVYISKDDGKIKSETLVSFSSNRATITTTLQKQTGYVWKDVSSKSITYSTPGTKLFTPTFSGTSGMKYRSKSLVEIKDSKGNFLESSIIYSDYITY